MSSLRCMLSVFGKHSSFIKLLNATINQRFAFLHLSKFKLGEIEIKMPSLSPTMTEGTIVKWIKKEGDTIEPGDVLCEIQTDKAVVALEVEEEGVLSKILVPEDTKNVPLGKIIALLVTEGEVTVSKEKAEEPVKSDVAAKVLQFKDGSQRLCGPSVKKLLAEYDIKPSDVPATGPQANLLKGDILNYIEEKKLKQVPVIKEKPQPTKKSEPKQIKGVCHQDFQITDKMKTTAQELVNSKTTIPHVYMKADCKIDKIIDYQKQLKKDGYEVSLNDFVIKCTAKALKKVPNMNIKNSSGHINISSLVASDNGYVSSFLKNADSLSIQLISENSGKIEQNTSENIGGSFRIFNLGSLGVLDFSPVLHPSEIAVLAVGATQLSFVDQKPVPSICLTLSINNEVVDEHSAGSFMTYLKDLLENPLNISLT